MATIVPVGVYSSSWYDPGSGAGGSPYATLDGNGTTRWAGNNAAPLWIVWDFGSGDTVFTDVTLVWEAGYASSYQLQTSLDGVSWTDIYVTTTANGTTDALTGLTGTGRYLRLYATVLAVPPFCSLYSATFAGTQGTAWILTPSSATASNSSNGAAANAIDGSITTRWGSGTSPGGVSSIYIDLGSTQTITSVAFMWEAAEPTGYNVQTSPNASSWTTVGSGTGAGMPPDGLVGASGRYVQVISTGLRFAPFMSLWNFSVINRPAAGLSPPADESAGQRQLRVNPIYRMSPRSEREAQTFLRAQKRAYGFASAAT